VLAGLAVCTLSTGLLKATTVSFATGAVTIGAGAAVNAQADINFNASTHTVVITLLNFQLDPKGIASAISGVEIDWSNLSGGATASLSSTTASTFTINTDGSITGASNVTTTQWLVETNVSDPTGGYLTNTIALCVVCKNVNGTSPPTELVVGGPAANKPAPYGYADGNNSITNNHSPYILGSGNTFNYTSGTPLFGMNTTPTWTLNVPQITASSAIVAVRFYFGSAYIVPGQEWDGSLVTPEPAAAWTMAGGMLAIAAGVWKKRRGQTR